jgi:hypothetical protein
MPLVDRSAIPEYFSNNEHHFSSIRYYAISRCGGLNVSGKFRNEYIDADLRSNESVQNAQDELSIFKKWREYIANLNKIIDGLHSEYNKISLTEVFVKTFHLKYPPATGMVKSDAQNMRKDHLLESIADLLVWVYNIPFNEGAMSSVCSKNVFLPLSRDYKNLPSKQIEKIASDIGVELKEKLDDPRLPREHQVDDVVLYPSGYIHGYQLVSSADNDVLLSKEGWHGEITTERAFVHEQASSGGQRCSTLAAALVGHTYFEAKREENGIDLTVKIDIPTLMASLKKKPVSDFIEK